MRPMHEHCSLLNLRVHIVFITYLIVNHPFPVIAASKVGAVEVFGYKPQETINSRQLHDPFPLHHQSAPIDHTLTHAAYSSPPPNTTMVQPSAKQFTDSPTMPTDITVSHPIVSDANARIPLYVYNPGLARKLGLSTLLMTSVIYGLSILPALFAATGSNPLGGLISSIGKKRKRRSYWTRNFWEMPLMNKQMTEKFLTLLETTMEVRKVNSSLCKQHHLCRVYQTALKEEDYLDESEKETEKISPNLSVFEKAVINMFGIAAERKDYHLNLGQAVKFYFESALVGITGSNCSKIFPCAEEIKYSQATKRIV
ncbi:uncharacterized protein LOC141851029 [Brevipalpus obovatus]|uniref:uncharacterized protein LOC141851029 n=1 Tax=Brevipalpus obovatus TaxID=246614 RepID=UPI003D9E3A11